MRATIVSYHGLWVLRFKLNGQMIKSYTFKRLIEAIDTASVLQLHVSNIDALPLTQYLNQRG